MLQTLTPSPALGWESLLVISGMPEVHTKSIRRVMLSGTSFVEVVPRMNVQITDMSRTLEKVIYA